MKAPKPTSWLQPAQYGRPREGQPEGNEWQASRFWVEDDGTLRDDLEGAQQVQFSPYGVLEQEGELLLRTTWYDADGEYQNDWLPYKHLEPDFGPKLNKFKETLRENNWTDEHALMVKYAKNDSADAGLPPPLQLPPPLRRTIGERIATLRQTPEHLERVQQLKALLDVQSQPSEDDEDPYVDGFWVQIGPSSIKGAVAGQDNGLIARRDIPKDTVLTNYKTGATKLNEAEFRGRYPTGKATHTWSSKKGEYYDASNPTTLASSANRGDAKTNNARITASGNVVTTKPIKAGQEIFLPYGGTFKIPGAAGPSSSAQISGAAGPSSGAQPQDEDEFDNDLDWKLALEQALSEGGQQLVPEQALSEGGTELDTGGTELDTGGTEIDSHSSRAQTPFEMAQDFGMGHHYDDVYSVSSRASSSRASSSASVPHEIPSWILQPTPFQIAKKFSHFDFNLFDSDDD